MAPPRLYTDDLARKHSAVVRNLEYRRRKRELRHYRMQNHVELEQRIVPPQHVLADRDHRASLHSPTITHAFFGDPLPGYSALDKIKGTSLSLQTNKPEVQHDT